MVQTMLKLVTSHEPIFRVASKTESMGHISVPPLYYDLRCIPLIKGYWVTVSEDPWRWHCQAGITASQLVHDRKDPKSCTLN